MEPGPAVLSTGRKVRLTGDTARRLPKSSEEILWDTELPGFGLRVRRSGHKSWILLYRSRGKRVRATLGAAGKLDAAEARAMARALLAKAATDGLPQPEKQKLSPTFAEYVRCFRENHARHWKPSTERGNRVLLFAHLVPTFGDQRLDQITRADILRWRDTMAATPGSFKNALPVLSVMLRYAEQLGHRRRGSNPCRGVPRFKVVLKERYLATDEFRRLASVLHSASVEWQIDVALVRLLMFTARACQS